MWNLVMIEIVEVHVLGKDGWVNDEIVNDEKTSHPLYGWTL